MSTGGFGLAGTANGGVGINLGAVALYDQKSNVPAMVTTPGALATTTVTTGSQAQLIAIPVDGLSNYFSLTGSITYASLTYGSAPTLLYYLSQFSGAQAAWSKGTTSVTVVANTGQTHAISISGYSATPLSTVYLMVHTTQGVTLTTPTWAATNPPALLAGQSVKII